MLEETDEVEGFAVGADGELRSIGRAACGGRGPCHLEVHPDGRHVLVANYGSGHVSAVALDDSGAPGDVSVCEPQPGSGPRADRQEGPHAHLVTTAPDGHVLATDLGTDTLNVLRLDTSTGDLERVSTVSMPAGCGPRHLVIHPGGFVHVLTEFASTVVVLEAGASYADLRIVDEVAAFAEPVGAGTTAAAIVLSEDGSTLWTTVRGDDRIGTLQVDDGGRRVRAVADVSSAGSWPRHALRTGGLLHVANERSGTVASFRVDRPDRVPVLVSDPAAVPSPVCLLAPP